MVADANRNTVWVQSVLLESNKAEKSWKEVVGIINSSPEAIPVVVLETAAKCPSGPRVMGAIGCATREA